MPCRVSLILNMDQHKWCEFGCFFLYLLNIIRMMYFYVFLCKVIVKDMSKLLLGFVEVVLCISGPLPNKPSWRSNSVLFCWLSLNTINRRCRRTSNVLFSSVCDHRLCPLLPQTYQMPSTAKSSIWRTWNKQSWRKLYLDFDCNFMQNISQ